MVVVLLYILSYSTLDRKYLKFKSELTYTSSLNSWELDRDRDLIYIVIYIDINWYEKKIMIFLYWLHGDTSAPSNEEATVPTQRWPSGSLQLRSIAGWSSLFSESIIWWNKQHRQTCCRLAVPINFVHKVTDREHFHRCLLSTKAEAAHFHYAVLQMLLTKIREATNIPGFRNQNPLCICTNSVIYNLVMLDSFHYAKKKKNPVYDRNSKEKVFHEMFLLF